MLQVGQTIDRYKVDSVIGTGGTAVVYLVHHTSLGTKHALKLLTVTSDVIRERMLQEGRVQATLVHPNVVAVTDVLDIDGQPGLLMEFIEGPSLQKAMREYKLPLEAAEVLFLGLLAGVKAAHDRGFIHRDIKPANVLLKQTESGFVPKVTDFGLAKILREEGEDAGRGKTRAGVAMGTPAYMASEQIRDAANVDRRADIFSLGCILYELVCGQRAFPGDDAIRIYNSIMGNDFRPPRELKPDLPDRLVSAIEGCLVLERRARIPDCDTLIAVISGEQTFEIRDIEPEFEEDPPTIETARPANPHAPEMQVAVADSDAPLGEDDPTNVGESNQPGRVVAKLDKFSAKNKRNVDDTILHDKVQPDVDPLYGPLGNSIVPTGEPDMDTIVQEDGPDDAPSEQVQVVQKGALGLFGWMVIGLIAMGVMGFAGGGLVVTYYTEQGGFAGLGLTDVVPGDTDPAGDTDPTTDTDPAGDTDPTTDTDPAGDTDPATDTDPAGDTDPDAAGDTDTDAGTDEPQDTDPGTQVAGPPVEPPPDVPSIHPTPDIGVVTPPKPPPAGPVTVKILSKPPTAALSIDGEDHGRTPAKLELLPGQHTVEVTSAGSTGSFTIKVARSGTNKWCYAFDGGQKHDGSCP